MHRKALNLLKFIASELTDKDGEVTRLLNVSNLAKIAAIEGTTAEELPLKLYDTFLKFGFEHAKGEFIVLFMD